MPSQLVQAESAIRERTRVSLRLFVVHVFVSVQVCEFICVCVCVCACVLACLRVRARVRVRACGLSYVRLPCLYVCLYLINKSVEYR